MTYVRPTSAPAQLVLPKPPDRYDAMIETERNRILVAADAKNLKHGQDVNLLSERLILAASDGSKWQVKVSTSGVLSTVSVP